MKITTNRMEAFSDNVISIIITIMVLSIKLPEIGSDDSSFQIKLQLKKLIPFLLAYVFSFMMIGIYWTNHHHLFHMLEKTDEGLLWLNMSFLFWMSLIPLATALIGNNPRVAVSTIVYGSIMLVTTLTLALMRTYSLKKDLIVKDQSKRINKKIYTVSLRARTKSVFGTVAYFLSIPLSFVDARLAYVCFIIPPIIFFIPDGIDEELLMQEAAAHSETKA